MTQIIKSGGEAIKKISNISSIADAAEQVIEDAAQILKIIPERNNSEDSGILRGVRCKFLLKNIQHWHARAVYVGRCFTRN